MKKNIFIPVAAVAVFGIIAYAIIADKLPHRSGNADLYEQITQEEAMEIMAGEEDYLIVDVRTPEEYAEGHIKGAINVPNETISDSEIDLLGDRGQLLLVYCRSGNRSKDASKKLSEIGYTNIKEFGGINTWEGEIVID